MDKELIIIKAFVIKWDTTQVWIYCFELKETRVLDIKPFFLKE
jgi:hypothetical protein